MIQPACHIPTISLEATLPERGWPHKKMIAPRGTKRLDTVFPTYAKVLRDHGYLTAHYGKWHLGDEPYSPLEHGFDVDVPHTKSHGPKGTYFGPQKYSDTFTLKAGEHLEDRMADEAVKFIHANKDRPFLLNYWAFSVHSPYFAKEELLEKYRSKAKGFPADAPQRNPIYAGMVETFDTNVGETAGISWLTAHGFDDWLIIDHNTGYFQHKNANAESQGRPMLFETGGERVTNLEG